MADYPDITLRSQIDVTTPSGGESASKLDDALRQVKKFLSTYLAVAHNDDGSISTVATSGLADLSVTTAKLTDLAVTTAKIADLAVTAAKIANATITAAQLATGAVGTTQIADLGVTTAKLAANAVDQTKLANVSVGTAQLIDANVTTVKILDATITNVKMAAASVTPDKFSNIGANKIIVGDGAAAQAASVGGALTMTYAAGVATFAVSGVANGIALIYAKFEEQKTNGTNGGGTTAATYVTRGPFTLVTGASDVFSISGNSIVLKKAGTYLIQASAPSTGTHRIRLLDFTNTVVLAVGTSEVTTLVGGDYNRSFACALITTTVDNVNVQVQHWNQSTIAATGLGFPCSSGDSEIYAQCEIIKF